MKCYKVTEEDLLEFLSAYHKLQVLERDGVDNWAWYMEGRKDYLKENGVSEEEIEDGFDFYDLARSEITGFNETK